VFVFIHLLLHRAQLLKWQHIVSRANNALRRHQGEQERDVQSGGIESCLARFQPEHLLRKKSSWTMSRCYDVANVAHNNGENTRKVVWRRLGKVNSWSRTHSLPSASSEHTRCVYNRNAALIWEMTSHNAATVSGSGNMPRILWMFDLLLKTCTTLDLPWHGFLLSGYFVPNPLWL